MANIVTAGELMEGGEEVNRDENWKKMLIVGVKFFPTDQELLLYYLLPKINGDAILYGIIADLNIYDYEPFELSNYAFDHGNGQLYFFTPRYRKHANGQRPNRFTRRGFWRATGKATNVCSSSGGNGVQIIGSKTCLVYYTGQPSADKNCPPKKTTWLMHEFIISPNIMPSSETRGEKLDEWVLCRIYFKESKKNEAAKTMSNGVREHQPLLQLPSNSSSLEPGQPLSTLEPAWEHQPLQQLPSTSSALEPWQPFSPIEPVWEHQPLQQLPSTSSSLEPGQPLSTLEPAWEHQPLQQLPSTSSALEPWQPFSPIEPVWEHQPLQQLPSTSSSLEPGQPLSTLEPVWEHQPQQLPSTSGSLEPGQLLYTLESVSIHQPQQFPSSTSDFLDPSQPFSPIELVCEHQPQQFPSNTSGLLEPGQPFSPIEPVWEHQLQQFPSSTSDFLEPGQPLSPIEPVWEHQLQQFPSSTSDFLELGQPFSLIEPVWEHQLQQFPSTSSTSGFTLEQVLEYQPQQFPSFSCSLESGQALSTLKADRTHQRDQQLINSPPGPVWEDQLQPILSIRDIVELGLVGQLQLLQNREDEEEVLFELFGPN